MSLKINMNRYFSFLQSLKYNLRSKRSSSLFDNLKIWEAQGTNFPPGYSKMSKEENIQIQASLDSSQVNCLFSHGFIEKTGKDCSDLWDSTLDIIKTMRCLT
jgi:hypothetical protein